MKPTLPVRDSEYDQHSKYRAAQERILQLIENLPNPRLGDYHNTEEYLAAVQEHHEHMAALCRVGAFYTAHMDALYSEY